MVSIGIAGAAAGMLGTGGSVFGYNRANFMYDRDLRQRKELKLMDFKVTQGALWREDVRDIVGLTEMKMAKYLIVNALELGFAVTLYCEGKMPPGSPLWLMRGYTVAVASAFMFLMMSVWMAMHAAVAAQSYQVRILTQLVRLPIPTWKQIEATRTYASDFEKVQPKQMLRVPFVTGTQEEKVGGTEQSEEAPPTQEVPEEGDIPLEDENTPVDPWGLERAGAAGELNCGYGAKEVAGLRHVAITRDASRYWQSYDAFARISMSLGTHQLLLAIVYYTIGYVGLDIGSTSVCWAAILAFVGCKAAFITLDMSVSSGPLAMLHFLNAAGPMLAGYAAYLWGQHTVHSEIAADYVISVAFVCHFLFLAVSLILCRVKELGNGAWLPTAYRLCLYLDAFGWVKGEEQRSGDETAQGETEGSEASEGSRQRRNQDREAFLTGGASSSPAAAPPTQGGVRYLGSWFRGFRPAASRPQDAEAEGDRSFLTATKKFLDPVSFFPKKKANDEANDDAMDMAMVTGHHLDMPGKLPWRIFSLGTMGICAIWIFISFASFVQAVSPWSFDADDTQIFAAEPALVAMKRREDRAALLATDAHHRYGAERIATLWPTFAAQVPALGLSCDASGRHFIATDGLQIFTSELKRQVGGPTLLAKFGEAPRCPALRGEQLQDLAMVCSSSGGEKGEVDAATADCRALVLHRRGRRVATCPLQEKEATSLFEQPLSARAAAGISDSWLGRRSSANEKVQSLAAYPTCKGLVGSALERCTFVGTSTGRVAQLNQHKHGEPLRLNSLLSVSEDKLEVPASGKLHFFNERYLGVLQPKSHSVQLIDLESDGLLANKIELPAAISAESMCFGGGHLYFMGGGAEKALWRMPAPKELVNGIAASAPPAKAKSMARTSK